MVLFYLYALREIFDSIISQIKGYFFDKLLGSVKQPLYVIVENIKDTNRVFLHLRTLGFD